MISVTAAAREDSSASIVRSGAFAMKTLSLSSTPASVSYTHLLFALEVFLFCVLGVTAVSLIVYAAYAVG